MTTSENKLFQAKSFILELGLNDEERMTLGMELVTEAGKNALMTGLGEAISQSPEAMGLLGGLIDRVNDARPPKSNRDGFQGA